MKPYCQHAGIQIFHGVESCQSADQSQDTNSPLSTSLNVNDSDKITQIGKKNPSQSKAEEPEHSDPIQISRDVPVEERQSVIIWTGTPPTIPNQTSPLVAADAICAKTEDSNNSKNSQKLISRKLSLPAGVKPYYLDERNGIAIICGDCREILPTLNADCILADLPYNVGKDYGGHDDSMSDDTYHEWLTSVLWAAAQACPEVIFFPGLVNLLNVSLFLPPCLRAIRVLGWHRKEFAGDLWTSGPAISWDPIVWASRSQRPFFNRIFGNGGRDFLVVNSIHGNPFRNLHPCPKPIEVMRWLVSLFAPIDGVMIDPCCGTGTTLRAAKDLSRQAIGIEICERYCEIAAKRLQQEVLCFRDDKTEVLRDVQRELL